MTIRPTTLSTPSTRTSVVAALAAVALALTACSDPADDEAADPASTPSTTPSDTPSSEPTEPTSTTPTASTPAEPAPSPTTTSAAPAGPTLSVTVDGDEITPNAEEIDLGVGEPLVIDFDADRGGELHVHSKPEQYVEFAAGRSSQTIVVETPGEVEIEEHDSGAVVAVVEVS